MGQYIDKDALVAEIDKTYNFHKKRGGEHDASICDVLYGLLHRIDTLEVKEVDLDFEKELYKAFGQVRDFTLGIHIAKHFFELGMAVSNKSQKGE